MKRLEQLITNVRFHTNEDSNRFKNIRFNKLFTDAQTEIQRIIVKDSDDNRHFIEDANYDLVSGQSEYTLPSDSYTSNSVNAVFRKLQNGSYASNSYQPLRSVTKKEIGRSVGYILEDNSIILSLTPRVNLTDGLVVSYIKRLPSLSVRFGQISGIASNVITITGYDASIDITDFDDYVCIVDKDGTIQDSGLYVESWNSGTGEITVTGSTFTGGANDYITIGKSATTHSQLPEECEKYLTVMVERMVHYINSSTKDFDVSNILTLDEKVDLVDLFKKNNQDVPYPPIVDSTYLN